MTPHKTRYILILLVSLLSGCTAAESTSTPFPTFTPLTGFQILGGNSPTPPAASTPSPTVTQESSPTSQPIVTPTQQPGTETPVPTIESEPPLVTLVFTGQIVPARCVQAETDLLGQADYIYESVTEILGTADLAIGALNSSITDFVPMTGCIETFVLLGSPIQADAMAAAGFDIMSIATNHIKNCGVTSCGDQAFLDTLANLERVGITAVGGGMNTAEATAPIFVEISGIRFAFVSLGQIEPLAFAGPDSPGIGALTEESLRTAIAAAKAQADVVIFMPHWGPEYTRVPNASQRALAEAAVDAGADLIIGNHTHYIQAYVTIGGVPVFFGLGNFVFDQTQETERQQSLIIRITYRGTEIISTEIFPVVNDRTGKVRVANQDEVVEILTSLEAVNQDLQEDYP